MNDKISTTTTTNNYLGLLLCFTIICLLSIGPFFNFQSVVLFVLAPLLLVIALKTHLSSNKTANNEYLVFFVFVVFSLLTVFYNPNYNYFLTAFNGIIGALIVSFIPVGLNKSNKNYELYFHLAFIISMIILILIEFSLGNFKLTSFASELASRGRFFFNANYYSYISYFASFSLFYLHIKYRNILTLTAAIILTILMLVLAFITQSRSGLLFILLLNTVFWLFIFKSVKKNFFQKLLKMVLITAVFILAIIKLIDIYSNSQIKKRVTGKDDSRNELVAEGLNVFFNTPITGVGLGQFTRYSKSKQFTHNSFVESFAEHGIIGGILMLILLISPFLKSFKLFLRNPSSAINKLNLLFFFTFLLYNNFYVFYKVAFAMIYFFLVVSMQNKNLIPKKS